MNATAQNRIEEVTLEQKEPRIYSVLEAKSCGGFFTALSWVFKAAEKLDAKTRHFFYRILRVEPEAVMATDGRRIHRYHCRQNLIPEGDWQVLQLTREVALLVRATEPGTPDWKRVFRDEEPPFRIFQLNLWIPKTKNLSLPYTLLVRGIPPDFSLDLAYFEDLRGFDWEVRVYKERKAIHFLNGAKEALIMGIATDLPWQDFDGVSP